MTIINTSPDRTIQLGYEGEDRVTVLRFRYSADWLENGEGVFHIRVRRHGENHAYNAQLVTVDLTHMELLMTVTNTELSVKGSGEMQVVYSGADFVKKSPIYSYNVSHAVDEAVDPPAQDVYTQIIESLSGLHDTVWDIDRAVAETDAHVGNLADLTTTAKTDLVSAINEVNEHGGGGSVTVDDVQINGTSIVTDGVAEIPIGTDSGYGVLSAWNDRGIHSNGGKLQIVTATFGIAKSGGTSFMPITPYNQHYSAFYGLAKAAGYDEKNSTLPVGTYSEEAKTAIRTMLGLQDVYEDYSSALDALGGGS